MRALVRALPRRAVWTSVRLRPSAGAPVPRPVQRYGIALVALGCIVTTLAATEVITSRSLRTSTSYKHSLQLVQTDARVQALLGVPLAPGLTVSSRRQGSKFTLSYSVYGPHGRAYVESVTRSTTKAATLLRLSVTLSCDDGRTQLLELV